MRPAFASLANQHNCHLPRTSTQKASKFQPAIQLLLIKKETAMGNLHSTNTTIHLHQPSSKYIEVYRGGKLNNMDESGLALTSYSIRCVNNTDENYYFAVYQKFPASPGLESVAWQVRRVPKRGNKPSTSLISWTLNYGLIIADWDKDQDKFTGSQSQDAELGEKYQVVTADSDFANIDPTPTGQTTPAQIQFKNNTEPPQAMDLSMGFSIGGNVVACQRKVHSGEGVQFDVHPEYYVALFRNIELGKLVDSDVFVGPLEVKFTDGVNNISVEAYMDDGSYRLKKE